MSSMRKVKINKKDFNRVLVTETIPYETPIIFSNDGFYRNVTNCDNFSGLSKLICKRIAIGESKKVSYTIPYVFKIKKNESEYRRLSVPHPIAQVEMRDFYEHYSGMITHFCSQSKFSIRAPIKIANTYYYKNLLENRNLYKNDGVETESKELLSKHSSSYFAYQGYDRLYKFYISSEFLKYEERFQFLYTLDVSKCFDSIYTHSISWATKDKLFTKGMLGNRALNFGDAFDRLMQRCNYNETHGLIIGPEISRIFAEIIFQKIDNIVCKRLAEMEPPSIRNIDYEIKRYVDDIFIFSKSDKEASRICQIFSDELNEYNMHVNNSKVTKNKRPFLTSKSKVIYAINDIMNVFINSFLEVDESLMLIPKEVYRKNHLTRIFIDKVKMTCLENHVSYDEVSSYIVAVIFERVKRLVSKKDGFDEGNMFSAAYALITVALFFYKVSPSVSASYKLASILIVMIRYVKQNIPDYSDALEQLIYNELVEYLETISANQEVISGVINLEAYNIIFALAELDIAHYLPPILVENVFKDMSSYYHIVSCLYIIKNNSVYSSTKNKVIALLNKRFESCDDILILSEKAMLYLDIISCPYIDKKVKKTWIRNVIKSLQEANPKNVIIDDYITDALSNPWFIDWKNVDLLSFLEKKQLKKAY
ncbi:antiviral reverse transcriptase Drt3b [Photorhabdus sp. CRCIA-P01]|uniref:antiviral reverse transcriptase Drt3b n=1 Tax=Photorhabdus sp. CRCIA-P01 TaxID=2019570 RepID=UPI0013003477|nr:antiviral reverse transcriptase Drt3b [Photorhabdus sp. CRCIA-P01]